MNIEEFKNCIAALNKCYGEEYYPTLREVIADRFWGRSEFDKGMPGWNRKEAIWWKTAATIGIKDPLMRSRVWGIVIDYTDIELIENKSRDWLKKEIAEGDIGNEIASGPKKANNLSFWMSELDTLQIRCPEESLIPIKRLICNLAHNKISRAINDEIFKAIKPPIFKEIAEELDDIEVLKYIAKRVGYSESFNEDGAEIGEIAVRRIVEIKWWDSDLSSLVEILREIEKSYSPSNRIACLARMGIPQIQQRMMLRAEKEK